MTESAEHAFISQSLNGALSEFAETKLLGIREAQRRTFDYASILLRDFSRPLVSQVLWNHQEGIEKDIRTLLFDGGSSLKLYFVRDNVKNRARIDEIIRSYRDKSSTLPLLRGLRVVTVPDGFDADSLKHQAWMTRFLRECIASDLLFGVVFGKLTSFDVATFSNHGGPVGLKFAALQTITSSGLDHTPTFQQQVGSKGSPLREVLTMLSATGLVGRVGFSVLKVPTLKGRFFLDLCRRIMFERISLSAWSDELRLIMNHLSIEPPTFGEEINYKNCRDNIVNELLFSISCCKSQCGIDIIANVDLKNPVFFSNFDWKKFANEFHEDGGGKLWDDTDDLDLFRETNKEDD